MSSPSTMETETARPVFSTDVSAECAAPSDDATLLASSAVQRAMDGAASRRTHDEWRARMIAARVHCARVHYRRPPWSIDAHVCSDAAAPDGASPDASASGSASDLATDRPGCKLCMGTHSAGGHTCEKKRNRPNFGTRERSRRVRTTTSEAPAAPSSRVDRAATLPASQATVPVAASTGHGTAISGTSARALPRATLSTLVTEVRALSAAAAPPPRPSVVEASSSDNRELGYSRTDPADDDASMIVGEHSTVVGEHASDVADIEELHKTWRELYHETWEGASLVSISRA